MSARRRNTADTLPFENRHSPTEQLLKDLKVDYTYTSNVPTSQINVERSRANNARRQTLVEATKNNYVNALRRGAVFPPIIAYRGNRGTAKKLTVVDGNHRVAAHAEVGKPLDVYELAATTPATTITLLTGECNTTNGLPPTKEERISHAVTHVDEGMSHREAADRMGIPLNWLTTALRLRDADNRAKEAGVNVRIWESIGPTARGRLTAITTDEIFKLAAILAADVPLTSDEVGKLVAKLRKTTVLAKQREILKNERLFYDDRIKASAGGLVPPRGPQTPKHRIALVASHLAGITDDTAAIADLYKGEEREEIAELLETVSVKIVNILKALRDGDE